MTARSVSKALTVMPLLAAASSLAFGQRFEAASIGPSPPIDTSGGVVFFGPGGGPGTEDPARYSCNFCNLSELVSQAYDLPEYRVSSVKRLPDDRFHVVAKVPPNATRDQFRLMLQDLLADRFGLRTHRESRDMQTVRLLVSSGGPKLKPHVDGAPDEPKTGARTALPGFTTGYRAKRWPNSRR